MSLISLKDLVFAYDDTKNTIDHVNLDIEKGSYVTIVGHNGSGKSTLAKLIGGLLEKKSGTITIDGTILDEEHISLLRKKIGIVFQNPDNQFIGSTVRDDIAFGLENHCIPQQDMDDMIEKYARLVNMHEFLDKEPSMLSGGQKQRVAIAGVLAMQPEVLIFDEATSMLDPQGKKEINQVIHDLHVRSKLTLLSITHDLDEALQSNYVIGLYQGKIILQGPPHEFFKHTDYIQQLQLELPFTIRFENALRKAGIKMTEFKSIEGMVDELCQ